MPQIGGVYVPDELMPSINVPQRARPSLGAIFGGAAEGTLRQVAAAIPYQFEVLTRDKVDPAIEQQYQRDLQVANQAFRRAAPATLEDATSGRVGIGRFIVENLVGSAPQMGATLAGGVAGGLAGGPGGALAGAVAVGAPIFSASNVGRAVEENGALTVDAAERAAVIAPFQAGADALVGRFLPGASKILGTTAAAQAGGFITRTAKSMVKAGATEAVTEAGQQLGERAAAGIELGSADAIAEYVNAGVTAFAVGGVLGAGGGFRRTNADAKPAEQVTNKDMLAKINGFLDGSLRASVPVVRSNIARDAEGRQIKLPAPPDFVAGPDGVTRVNPSGTVQLALPSPEMDGRNPDGSIPEVALQDAAGRTVLAPNVQPDLDRTAVLLANLPRQAEPPLDLGAVPDSYPGNFNPDLRAALERITAPRTPLAASTSLSRGLQLPDLEAAETTPAVEMPEGSFRPLKDDSADDILAAVRDSRSAPQLKAAAEEELGRRRLEAIGEAELTTDNFQQRVDELKVGLRGGWVQQLTATDPNDLADKVYDQIFVEQDTRANTRKLAQRMGILNESMEPGPLAQQVEARRAAAEAAPAAPAPAAPQVTERLSTAAPTADQQAEVQAAIKAAGIQKQQNALKGLNLQTPADVMAALAGDSLEGARGSNARVTQVEKIAQQLGLITNDDARDITPKGRRVFLESVQGLEATTSAAADNGYTGAAASQFDRGVRAYLSGQEQTTFSSFEEMAAYNAGRAWGENFVVRGETIGAQRTAQIIGSQEAARLGRRQAAGQGSVAPREGVGNRRELTPEQLQVQAINRMIDAADLSRVRDDDIAQLRKLARNGASAETIGRLIQNVQAGRRLFQEGERSPFRPAPQRPDGRGQPRFKELNTRIEANKAQYRFETKEAVRVYELRQLVQMALTEKAITKARAERLNAMLDKNDVKAVERNMKTFLAEARAGSLLGAADSQFEQFVGTKDFMGLIDHMVDFAPSAYHRAVMSAVRNLAKQLQKQGVKLNFVMVRPGDMGPAALNNFGNRGLTIMQREPAEATIYLKSGEFGSNVGMNYQIAAHELLHAVTISFLEVGNTRGIFGATKLGRAVQDLYELQGAIARHFKARVAEAQRGGAPLTQFEQDIYQRTNNSMSNVDEILVWGMTNPEMQEYLAGIEYRPKQSLFGRLVELLGQLLGLDVKYNSALTELLRVSEQLFAPDARDLEATFPRNNPDLYETAPIRSVAAIDGAASATNRTAQVTNDVTKQIAQLTDKVVEALKPEDFTARGRRVMLGWLSHNQIDRMFGRLMPGLLKHSDAHRERVAVRSRYEQMFDTVYQRFEKLERDNPKAAEWVGQLMATATEFQIDPDKAFEQHSHLGWTTDAEGNRVVAKGKEQEVARLKRVYDQVVQLKNNLRRGNGEGWQVFSQMRALNEAQNYSRMAAQLHSLVAMDPELALGVADAQINPVDRFMRQEGLTDPVQIRDWWQKALGSQITAAKAFVTEKMGEAKRSGEQADVDAMQRHLSPIELQISAMYEAMKSMKKAPYFHLGRFGNYFGSAVVAKQADGTADPKAMSKLAAALEAAGFDDVQISTDNTRPRFMLRFETQAEMQKFEQLMLKLQKEGVISKDDKIKRGPRNSNQNFGVADGLPEYVARYIQSLEASPSYVPDEDATPEQRALLEQHKQQAIRLALDTWLEQQPDSSISKVLVKRYTVAGYKKDMMRNAAHRWRVGSISLSNVAAAPKFNQAFIEMRSQVNQALVAGPDGSGADPVVLNDLMNEMRLRDAGNPINEAADTWDKLRAVAHAYFLGLSPAYGMINMTQLGVVALPELAKKHGYSKSFAAMRRSGGSAFKILKAVVAEASKLEPKRWADVAITEDVLRKAGLSSDEISFTLQMLATGTIDIGSAARALGQIAEDRAGSRTDVALKYASAIGMYTETFSRLTTALAARELQGGSSAETAAYATQVVSNSMFDYQSWNTARQLGKRGFLGPVTPIVTQFMSYSVQLTEKLYSEVIDAAGRTRPGETDAQAAVRRKAARSFLLGHLTAVTALAGTMGLPFATVFAAAIERIVDAVDDDEEPFDATAAYRNFVADVFGQQVGEVISRGLPRALGFDISARAGEQNLLPFSEFIADRRPWKEAVEAYSGRSLGVVPSMLSNVVTGAGKIADGDLLGGMKDMLPVAFKGPIETYRMTSEGYIDSRGNKLPLSPTASSYLWQIMGFSPAARAEYGEARADQASRRGEVNRRAQRLRQQIVKAMIEGDMDQAAELVTEAQQFDLDNPAFAVIPSLAGSVQRQVQARSRAAALQTPIGVGLDDIAGQQLTNYANIGVTQ